MAHDATGAQPREYHTHFTHSDITALQVAVVVQGKEQGVTSLVGRTQLRREGGSGERVPCPWGQRSDACLESSAFSGWHQQCLGPGAAVSFLAPLLAPSPVLGVC